MHFLTIIAALAALATATPVLHAERADIPDPNSVYVEKVSWVGTGCPPNSASYELAESATVVSLGFSKYVAGTGTGMTAADARKNCDVRITLHYPQGWTWTVATTDLRGYASLPSGCSAKMGATYFFSGQSNDASSMVTFNGPVDNNYRMTTSVPAESLVWATCGVTGPLFNVNSQVVVTCKTDAYVGVDTQDTKFTMKLHLQWKRC
ncbi:hypothetical protein BCR34DRAFT_492672 [Clohesyomyces aquaticus]|uniref:Secreted protein n=1 Tax=Clohesyomyces aquaticus TaxID=1231657 RepID=A0A1Y1YYC5_9PLEO|nr:hypothetical protein BCR34DRAFT_492672 [Clohesyomyces aquaticus]